MEKYKEDTGNNRHLKCGEMNCISQAMSEGVEWRGSTFRSVTVGESFGKEHGTPMAPCLAHCQPFLKYFGMTADPSEFPPDWRKWIRSNISPDWISGMDKTQEVAQLYGYSFDSLVDLVANALAAAGYPSKHASAQPTVPSSKTYLKGSVVGLGSFLAKMETDLSGPLPPGRSEVSGKGFLSIYAAAKRLVILFRYAQSAGSIEGLAAAEVDGDVDTLEEAVMRPEDPEAVVEAAESIVATSLRFQDVLPKALQEQILELHELLGD